MKLEHGTEKEHKQTVLRAKQNGVQNIMTSTLTRNPYLQENFNYSIHKGWIKAELVEDYVDQCSYYTIEYLI